MKTYPKIDTLFNRGPDFKVNVDDLRNPVFGLIDRWLVTEKVDGTNIRVNWNNLSESFNFGGRTDRANLPGPLVTRLHEIFDGEQAYKCRQRCLEYGLDEITFFGEGYGPGIQNGGLYGPSVDFILFDVLVNDSVWLEPGDVAAISISHGLTHVPIIDKNMALEDVIIMASSPIQSRISEKITACEGIIARPRYNLFDQRGNRVMFKLKTKDFRENWWETVDTPAEV